MIALERTKEVYEFHFSLLLLHFQSLHKELEAKSHPGINGTPNSLSLVIFPEDLSNLGMEEVYFFCILHSTQSCIRHCIKHRSGTKDTRLNK